ncbi:MAG: hypothetical protein EBQ78_03410 [Betaproteobacteria bacterium]|nr:hypothetical protein [Betaproteobacteria bacterium]
MFDRCYDVLTDANRALIRSVVQTRLKGPFDELVGSRPWKTCPMTLTATPSWAILRRLLQ